MDIPKSDQAIKTDTLRDLLSDAFTKEDLGVLIYDHFRPLHDKLTPGLSKRAIVQMLIVHAANNKKLNVIINIVRSKRSGKYSEFEHKLFEQELEGTLKSASRENGGSRGFDKKDRNESPVLEKTLEIPPARIILLRTYVALLNDYVYLITFADRDRQEIRRLRDTINILDQKAKSGKWNIDLADLGIRSIFPAYQTLSDHVLDDLKNIESYKEKPEFDQNRKEEFHDAASNLEKEIKKLTIIDGMYHQIDEPAEDEVSNILKGIREDIEKLNEDIEELVKSASSIRIVLFKDLKSQVERLSRALIDV